MKIEIGKTYAVSPQWKKSLVEIEMFKHNETNKCVNVETVGAVAHSCPVEDPRRTRRIAMHLY